MRGSIENGSSLLGRLVWKPNLQNDNDAIFYVCLRAEKCRTETTSTVA